MAERTQKKRDLKQLRKRTKQRGGKPKTQKKTRKLTHKRNRNRKLVLKQKGSGDKDWMMPPIIHPHLYTELAYKDVCFEGFLKTKGVDSFFREVWKLSMNPGQFSTENHGQAFLDQFRLMLANQHYTCGKLSSKEDYMRWENFYNQYLELLGRDKYLCDIPYNRIVFEKEDEIPEDEKGVLRKISEGNFGYVFKYKWDDEVAKPQKGISKFFSKFKLRAKPNMKESEVTCRTDVTNGINILKINKCNPNKKEEKTSLVGMFEEGLTAAYIQCCSAMNKQDSDHIVKYKGGSNARLHKFEDKKISRQSSFETTKLKRKKLNSEQLTILKNLLQSEDVTDIRKRNLEQLKRLEAKGLDPVEINLTEEKKRANPEVPDQIPLTKEYCMTAIQIALDLVKAYNSYVDGSNDNFVQNYDQRIREARGNEFQLMKYGKISYGLKDKLLGIKLVKYFIDLIGKDIFDSFETLRNKLGEIDCYRTMATSGKGIFFMISDFVKLGSLDRLLAKERSDVWTRFESSDKKDYGKSFLNSETWNKYSQLIQGCARGMRYLHSIGVVHMDLAARNVMISMKDGVYHPKIADFGLSFIMRPKDEYVKDEYVNLIIGNNGKCFFPLYQYPIEAYKDLKIGKYVDCYSFGTLLFHIISLMTPVMHSNQIIQYEKQTDFNTGKRKKEKGVEERVIPRRFLCKMNVNDYINPKTTHDPKITHETNPAYYVEGQGYFLEPDTENEKAIFNMYFLANPLQGIVNGFDFLKLWEKCFKYGDHTIYNSEYDFNAFWSEFVDIKKSESPAGLSSFAISHDDMETYMEGSKKGYYPKKVNKVFNPDTEGHTPNLSYDESKKSTVHMGWNPIYDKFKHVNPEDMDVHPYHSALTKPGHGHGPVYQNIDGNSFELGQDFIRINPLYGNVNMGKTYVKATSPESQYELGPPDNPPGTGSTYVEPNPVKAPENNPYEQIPEDKELKKIKEAETERLVAMAENADFSAAEIAESDEIERVRGRAPPKKGRLTQKLPWKLPRFGRKKSKTTTIPPTGYSKTESVA